MHPYYVSALGPGTAVMVGAGLAAMAPPARRRSRLLILAAVLATAAVQIALLHRAHYLGIWQVMLLPAAAAGALIAMTLRRFSRVSLAAALAVLLVAPTAYAATTWRQPVEGTFPAAGPHAVGGNGGAELSRAQLATDEALMRYVLSHGAGGRFQLLTEASLTADSPILLGLRASALGGYGGVDPALDGPSLGRLVASGQARYVLLGGGYAYLGGNAASRAAATRLPAGTARGLARRAGARERRPVPARLRRACQRACPAAAVTVSSVGYPARGSLAWVTARSSGTAGPRVTNAERHAEGAGSWPMLYGTDPPSDFSASVCSGV